MARKARGDESAVQAAMRQVQNAVDADALRAAQAVLLPLLGLSLAQTAQVVGRDRYWVSRARNRHMRGEPVPGQHGGRRNAILAGDPEVAFVKNAIRTYHPSVGRSPYRSLRSTIRHLLDQRAGRPVSEAAVTALMRRTAPHIAPGATGKMLEDLSWSLAAIWGYERHIAELVANHRAFLRLK